jgi:hypothetical protein
MLLKIDIQVEGPSKKDIYFNQDNEIPEHAESSDEDDSDKAPPIIKNKSILSGKKPIGFDDLDFEIVREIKSAK